LRFLSCFPCLASARLRHPQQKSIKNCVPRGALQFSDACFVQDKENLAENIIIFSRDFLQYWEKQALENLLRFRFSLLIDYEL